MINDSSKETQEKIHNILRKHSRYKNRNWTKEMICTVFALQEGISRLRNRNIQGYRGRGSGTVTMIEMFNDIGKSEQGRIPQMTIISGNTQIKFTDRYKIHMVNFSQDPIFGSGDRKIIAFNNENDIYQPPDIESVKHINEYFPGTIISLKFYLDNKYLAKRKGNGS